MELERVIEVAKKRIEQAKKDILKKHAVSRDILVKELERIGSELIEQLRSVPVIQKAAIDPLKVLEKGGIVWCSLINERKEHGEKIRAIDILVNGDFVKSFREDRGTLTPIEKARIVLIIEPIKEKEGDV